MPTIEELNFREYVGHAIVTDLKLDRQLLVDIAGKLKKGDYGLSARDLKDLPQSWDFEADGSLMWARVDHNDGIILTYLCPCYLKGDKPTIIADQNPLAIHGITMHCFLDERNAGSEVYEILPWEDLLEPFKSFTHELDEECRVSLSTSEAREDELLDPWRDPFYPDLVRAVYVPAKEGDLPKSIFARVERRTVNPEEPSVPYWEATLMGIVDNGMGDLPSHVEDHLLLRQVNNLETDETLMMVAFPQPALSEKDYDPDEDKRCNGDLSLEIGARYYCDGMDTDDEFDHDKRIECFSLAKKYYALSAELGNAQAMCNLGYIYSYGRLGKHDYQAAATWYKAAADLGHAEAAYKYGDMLYQGSGVDEDLEQAFFYYSISYQRCEKETYPATWGSAALRLAECYEHGTGCEKDLQRAKDLYLEAEMGLEEAIEDEPWYSSQLDKAREGIARLIG